MEFVHLHLHTEYSLLDGSGKIKNIIKKAVELNMKSIAITDHGTMYGCVDFYKEAKEQGIKPILGSEIYVVPKSMNIKHIDKQNETYHLVLLVKNEIGYNNLMKIVSAASIDGFYYKPRVDYDFLESHSEGLIALSACLGGEVKQRILENDLEGAKKTALKYKSIFKEGFYLEIQDHDLDDGKDEITNKELIKMSKELDIPLVVTNDVHYVNKEDSKSHDVLICIQTGKIVSDTNRMKYPSDTFYLKSADEMYEKFSYISEALENTVKIADECNFDYVFHESKLPKFTLPDGVDSFEYLKELCFEGVNKKYVDVTSEIEDRLLFELNTIKNMGYVDYFLITWDFMRFCEEREIMTGPGRGSAAGSIVAYALNITKIDPLKYNLLFERFLNPERISMPDIDSDFCYERRQEVIDYVIEKYGEKNVSQIITFGTMAARAVIRDVGRAMNYSYGEVDKIAKMIPSMIGITIEKALVINNELNSLYESDERIKELIDISKDLEGLPRHASTHAAGIVIASKPLVNYVPLQKNEDMIVTQFPMNTLEELGLLKMDFLGLRTLTVIRDAIEIISQTRGINLEIDKIDTEDPEVYKMIGEGKTVGIFQLESDGMTNFMRDLKPDSLEDIIAGISLYRPGPMAEIPRYIKNKKDLENITYITEKLKPILEVTYGCMIYQEQVMEIVRELGGYSMGRSDLVRRAMSKKKHKVMEEERKNFIYGIVNENGEVELPGCIRNGIDENTGNKIFDQMMDFASYAFNKSHAAAYALIGYETAYLMKYYTIETIAALLNSISGFTDKVVYYLRYAKSIGIKILPPDINKSYRKFTVEGDNSIRFGLMAIKNVGYNVIENIVHCRKNKGEFKDIYDFITKIDFNHLNKRVIESLIKAGAMDSFKVERAKLLGVYERLLENVSKEKKNNIEGQMTFFDLGNQNKQDYFIEYKDIGEFSLKQKLSMEKEMTGLYISGHPLEEYEESLKIYSKYSIEQVLKSNDEITSPNYDSLRDGSSVCIGGIITNLTKKITKNNTLMIFFNLEDLTDFIEVIVFSRNYEDYREILLEDNVILINGRISVKEDERTKIILENCEILPIVNNVKLYVQLDDQSKVSNLINTLCEIRNQNSYEKMDVPIYVYMKDEKKGYILNKKHWISNNNNIINNIKNIYGKNNVVLK